MRRFGRAGPLVAMVLLAACTSGGSAAPTESTSAPVEVVRSTPTPSPTPTPDADAALAAHVRFVGAFDQLLAGERVDRVPIADAVNGVLGERAAANTAEPRTV